MIRNKSFGLLSQSTYFKMCIVQLIFNMFFIIWPTSYYMAHIKCVKSHFCLDWLKIRRNSDWYNFFFIGEQKKSWSLSYGDNANLAIKVHVMIIQRCMIIIKLLNSRLIQRSVGLCFQSTIKHQIRSWGGFRRLNMNYDRLDHPSKDSKVSSPSSNQV